MKLLIGSFKNAYIVFDAVDKCRERDELLALIDSMHNRGLNTSHILVTSQRQRVMRRSWGPCCLMIYPWMRISLLTMSEFMYSRRLTTMPSFSNREGND